jgi:ADP-ribosylglycohydrolase
MQLTLKEKWAIDSLVLNTGAIATRLYPAIYGAILGDSRNVGEKNKWSGISVNLFSLMEEIITGQHKDEFLKKYDTIDLITYISPLVFTFAEKFDFLLIQRTVEKYVKVTLDGISERLGCIIYLEILFRLYHNDDFEGARKITAELCSEYLINTEYASCLPEYDRILRGDIKNIPHAEPNHNFDIVHTLEIAIWCCQNSLGVQDAISKAVSSHENSATIATLTGTMAGLYFREDISPLLPETNYDYNRKLAQFLDYCAKINN